MAPSRELEDWERSAQAGFSRRPGHEPRILTSFWGGILDPRNNANNYGGLGYGPYDNTLAANIAAGSRLVNAAPAGHWPREVSYWSLSSSSSSEYDSDNNGNCSPDSNGNCKPRPRCKNKKGRKRRSKGKIQKNTDDADDGVEEVIWIPESQRNSANLELGRDPRNSDQEVIYDLDERAMSKLPDHLQDNMREMQQERVERLQRENKNVPIRRHSAFNREGWFRNLILQRSPPKSSRSSTVCSSDSHDTDYTPTRTERQEQGQEEEDPDIIRPVCPGDVHEAYYEDTTGEYHGNTPGWYKRVGHDRGRRVHRATSTKDTFGYGSSGGSHLNEGPRRSEPCLALPYLRQTDGNLATTATAALSQTCPKQEVDVDQDQYPHEQRQVAAEEASPRVQKKRSLFFRSPGMRARVKKSIYKLSKAFSLGQEKS